jgi:hypothetical protein
VGQDGQWTRKVIRDVPFKALLVAVCTTFPVHCSYWPRQDTSPHSISGPPFQNTMLCIHRNSLTYILWPWKWRQHVISATLPTSTWCNNPRAESTSICAHAPSNLHGHHLVHIYFHFIFLHNMIPFIEFPYNSLFMFCFRSAHHVQMLMLSHQVFCFLLYLC